MCGIIGFYTKNQPTLKHKKLMEEGLLVDVLRGSCGTGVAGVKEDRKVQVYKKALAGPDFIQHDVFDRYTANFQDYRIHLGHNRAATHGDARDEHSHPFHIRPASTKEDEIVLIHNGTVRNFNNLSPQGFIHAVDSAHIAAGMASFGELATLEKLDGWFVLVWANVTKGTFNIAKGACRDIGIIQQEDDKGVLFASEFLMLNWLTERNGISTKANFLTPNEYEWWQWNMNDNKTTQIHKTAFKKYTLPAYGNYNKANRHGYEYEYPGSTDYLAKSNGGLAALGFEHDELIQFEVKGFVPYGKHNETYGWAWGEEVEYDSKVKVKIHQLSKVDYDEIFCNPLITKSMTGRAVMVETSAFVPSVDGPYVIVRVDYELARLRIKTIEEDKASGETCLVTIQDGIKKEPPIKEIKADNVTVFPHLKGSVDEKKPPIALLTVLPGETLLVPGPKKDYVELKEWNKLVEDGCAQCSSPIQPRHFSDISWVGEMGNQPLCHFCSEELSDYKQSQRSGV